MTEQLSVTTQQASSSSWQGIIPC